MQHAICEPSHLYILGNHDSSKRKAKIAWARGGCLGAGSRRRARQAAIVWGEAHTALDPQVPEWGNPAGVVPRHPPLNAIGGEEATRGTETSKYPEEEKSTEIALVAASERARCPNRRDRHSLEALVRRCCGGRRPGAPDPGRGDKSGAQPNGLGRPAAQGESPVGEARPASHSPSRVGPDTRNPARIRGDHPPRLNTLLRPIANQYREGKVKSTPRGE